jgi:hypothetical protein
LYPLLLFFCLWISEGLLRNTNTIMKKAAKKVI